MNPLTQIKNTQKATKLEIQRGFSESASWHAQYKDSAYIFAGGLDYELTEGDLLAVFAQYGEIVDVNLVRSKETGESKGFAFLAYEDQRSTVLAVDNLSGAKVAGRTIRVEHVRDYKRKKAEVEGEDAEEGPPEAAAQQERWPHDKQHPGPPQAAPATASAERLGGRGTMTFDGPGSVFSLLMEARNAQSPSGVKSSDPDGKEQKHKEKHKRKEKHKQKDKHKKKDGDKDKGKEAQKDQHKERRSSDGVDSADDGFQKAAKRRGVDGVHGTTGGPQWRPDEPSSTWGRGGRGDVEAGLRRPWDGARPQDFPPRPPHSSEAPGGSWGRQPGERAGGRPRSDDGDHPGHRREQGSYADDNDNRGQGRSRGQDSGARQAGSGRDDVRQGSSGQERRAPGYDRDGGRRPDEGRGSSAGGREGEYGSRDYGRQSRGTERDRNGHVRDAREEARYVSERGSPDAGRRDHGFEGGARAFEQRGGEATRGSRERGQGKRDAQDGRRP